MLTESVETVTRMLVGGDRNCGLIEIRKLTGAEARASVVALAGVMLDCVQGGASVGFMASLTRAEAEAFWGSVADAVQRGDRILIAAFLDSTLVGTVQVVAALPPNQPHRSDVAKLLVLQSARGRGVATLLVQAAEEASRAVGRTLLVLDTVTGGDAERLYLRLGWTKAGVIPNYALYPDGSWCDTTVFWKQI